MSQENVEIVRRAFTAFERDGLAGMLPHFDCEIEWTTTDGHIEPATYRGYEGVLGYFGTMAREIDGIRLEALELIDAGEQVVLTWRIHGRAKLSGASVEMTLTSVSLLCDGKIVGVRNYSDKTQALEAVGLRE
jgi:ketosteroid isomerase-like protein